MTNLAVVDNGARMPKKAYIGPTSAPPPQLQHRGDECDANHMKEETQRKDHFRRRQQQDRPDFITIRTLHSLEVWKLLQSSVYVYEGIGSNKFGLWVGSFL